MAGKGVAGPLKFMFVGFLLMFTTEVQCKPTTCANHYQNTLEYLLTLKETCEEASFKDCCQVSKGAHFFSGAPKSGVYNISNICSTGHQPFLSHGQSITVLQALYDMDTDNGGWMVILKRNLNASPHENFNRTWVEYENGFGHLNTEFWYGLKNIHCLTKRDHVELMIELKQNDGTGETWTYQTFKLDGHKTNYVLHIGEADGHGAAFDYMAYHNGHPFSTFDRDNDRSTIQNGWSNCANNNGGGWWFDSCFHASLTRIHSARGNVYHPDTGFYYFPYVEMKVRPKKCLH